MALSKRDIKTYLLQFQFKQTYIRRNLNGFIRVMLLTLVMTSLPPRLEMCQR